MLFLFHVSEDRICILEACFVRSCCHICWELGNRVEADGVSALGWSALEYEMQGWGWGWGVGARATFTWQTAVVH